MGRNDAADAGAVGIGDLEQSAVDHSDGSAHTVTLWNTAISEKRTTYTLKSKGGSAVYYLSADGKLLFANRSSPAPDVPAVIPYDAATGREAFAK